MAVSARIMRQQGVTVDEIRAVEHDIAPGVQPDMREHGWKSDDWPALAERILAVDILVIGTLASHVDTTPTVHVANW
jgi:multimeric flavodoxin WrbA